MLQIIKSKSRLIPISTLTFSDVIHEMSREVQDLANWTKATLGWCAPVEAESKVPSEVS